MRLCLTPAVAFAAMVWGAVQAEAQPRGPVAVLDQDALFAESEFGRRTRAEVEAASNALAAENREIEAALAAEERDLTERRRTMEAGAFRELAAAFDRKVEGIRQAQDAKTRAIQQMSERARVLFLDRTRPLLVALADELGAAVVLDRRVVIVASDRVDITRQAIERLDEALGDGAALMGSGAPPPRPEAPKPDASAETPGRLVER